MLLLLYLGITTSAWAAAPPRIDDKGIRIGLRDGTTMTRSRNGVWTPVTARSKPVPTITARQFSDCGRDHRRRGRSLSLYRLGTGHPSQQHASCLCLRPPRQYRHTFSVALQQTDGSEVQRVEDLSRDPSKKAILEPSEVLYLTLGSSLHGLKSRQNRERLASPAA